MRPPRRTSTPQPHSARRHQKRTCASLTKKITSFVQLGRIAIAAVTSLTKHFLLFNSRGRRAGAAAGRYRPPRLVWWYRVALSPPPYATRPRRRGWCVRPPRLRPYRAAPAPGGGIKNGCGGKPGQNRRPRPGRGFALDADLPPELDSRRR